MEASGASGSAHRDQDPQGVAHSSPFILQQQPTLVVTQGGQTLLPMTTGGSGGGAAPPAAAANPLGLQRAAANPLGLQSAVQGLLWEQPAARVSSDSSAGGLGLAGGGSSLPLAMPLLQPGAGYPPLPMAPQQQQQQQPAPAKPKGRKPARPYKPPDVQAAEKKKAAEAKEHCRQLEQQLGRARAELQRLQQENQALQRKAQALAKHSSFRRTAAAMAEGLTQITQLPSAEWGQGSAQAALAAAERGLPPPDALEQLRRMALPEAVSLYNSTVARVRQLLQQADHGPGQAEAQAALADLFAFSGGSGGTFGYLQVVSPQVYAELMQAKLDPCSPVGREDPSHWRSVLAAMRLSEDQEAQLIVLLQSHLAQAELLGQRKSRVMQQLAEELTSDLQSLELSGSLGSSELSAALSPLGSGDGGAADGAASGSGGGGGSVAPLPAKDELQQLIQLEYWLRFDFTGAVRKLLAPQQQALCMVASWPFYPDQRQLADALRGKAGQLWEQLRRTSA